MGTAHKTDIREKVWVELRKVARPDSRFHFNFAEFIADFEGSSAANDLLMAHPSFVAATTVFITPDNCLEELRFKALQASKQILVTSYSIKRGFWLLSPDKIPRERWEYASTLDGMERIARHITLQEIKDEKFVIDLMVTGTGAINLEGIRFGKGHGFFDLEWAMLYSIKAITTSTTTAAVVHDCQVLDEPLVPEIFDTVCDLVVTPTRLIEKSQRATKPTCGIVWDLLAPGMLEDIPPLRELKEMKITLS